MNNNVVLIWNGEEGTIEYGEQVNMLESKPKIKNLRFEELYYNGEEGEAIKVTENGEYPLNKNEIYNIINFVKNYQFKEPSLDEVKEDVKLQINDAIKEVLSENFDWRVLKLMELVHIGEADQEELTSVIEQKKIIRDIGNKYIKIVDEITNIEDIDEALDDFETELEDYLFSLEEE